MTDHDCVSIKELPFRIYCEYFAYYRTWNKQAKQTIFLNILILKHIYILFHCFWNTILNFVNFVWFELNAIHN